MLQKFKQYLIKEKNYSPLTVKAYLRDIENFRAFLQTKSFTVVQNQDVRAWIASMSNKGMSEKTINRKVASLKSFYKFLLKTGTISNNPLQHISGLKVSKKIPLPFSTDEMTNLFEQNIFDESYEGFRDKALIGLLYYTGIRRAELIHIREQDIDFHKKELKVLGKRNKERIIPLLSNVIEYLNAYRQAKIEFFNNEQTDAYFFLTRRGKKMYEMLVYRIINSYLSRVSLKHKKSPHILRHTFATHLLNNGADLNSIKELLGHSSLAATQVYTHSSIMELKKIYQKAHPRSRK